MLEIRNLTAGYGGEPVLRDVSLSAPVGNVTVIVGPNGCGKSTLLKALAGILPASGSVTLRGRELSVCETWRDGAAGETNVSSACRGEADGSDSPRVLRRRCCV